MRHKIVLYLLIFTVLFTIFIYVNDKRILDSLQDDLEKREVTAEELKNENKLLSEENDRLRYFSLLENDDAIGYFDNMGIDSEAVIEKIEEALISSNASGADNKFVPYDGMEGAMQINKFQILNHKWVIADFTDGTYWGEVFFTYEVDKEGNLSLTPVKSFLYPQN